MTEAEGRNVRRTMISEGTYRIQSMRIETAGSSDLRPLGVGLALIAMAMLEVIDTVRDMDSRAPLRRA